MSVENQLQAIQSTLLDIREDMGFVKGLIKGIRVEQEDTKEHVRTTSARVGKLEQRISHLLGWTAGLAAVVSLVFSFVKTKIFG